MVIVPIVHQICLDLRRAGVLERSGDGKSILTASILLGMMILPTIIGVTESAIRAVPEQYYEGALALGATHERSIFRVVLPAAKSGVLAGVILGIGRAIGETMAVIYGSGKSAENAGRNYAGCQNTDGKYRYGNGICCRFTQGSIDCNGSCPICIYFNYQFMCIIIKQEVTQCLNGKINYVRI